MYVWPPHPSASRTDSWSGSRSFNPLAYFITWSGERRGRRAARPSIYGVGHARLKLRAPWPWVISRVAHRHDLTHIRTNVLKTWVGVLGDCRGGGEPGIRNKENTRLRWWVSMSNYLGERVGNWNSVGTAPWRFTAILKPQVLVYGMNKQETEKKRKEAFE